MPSDERLSLLLDTLAKVVISIELQYAVIAVTATEVREKSTTVVNDRFRVDYADVCLAAA